MKRVGYFTPLPKRPKLMPKPNTCPENFIKDSVSVFCRIRPPNDSSGEMVIVPLDLRTIKLTPPVSSFAFRNGSAKEQLFKFKRVFSLESSQKDVFESVAKPLISDLLCGKNALLFVYGITGSGKTYTMEGTRQDGGILRRSIRAIFNSISDFQTVKYVFKPDKMNGFEVQSEADAMLDRQKFDLMSKARRANRKEQMSCSSSLSSVGESSKIIAFDEDNGYAVFVNYIEIYNNYVYDLLEEFAGNNMTKELQSKILREDARRNMYVHGCTEVEVKSPEEAFEVLLKGQKRRKVAHTKLNLESSRSHSIFTVRIVQVPHDARGESLLTEKSAVIVSQFSMVDLAGSERNNRTKATGDRIKEAGNINNSLMVLRQCIETMRENQLYQTSKKVPYRESKLTHYFKNYFEGEGKVNMIVCVNPRTDDYDETLPVMKFAELASEVKIHLPSSVQRPEFGFTHGRRRANQVLKEARRCIEEDLRAKELYTIETPPKYSLGPGWSPTKISSSSSSNEVSECLDKVVGFLKKRMDIKSKFLIGIKDEELNLRKAVGGSEKENVHLRQENSSYKSLYDDAMKKLKFMESRLLSAEVANDSLHQKFSDYNSLIDELRLACEERDNAKAQGQIEKQKMKTRLKVRLESEREKMMSDMNGKLMEQKSQLKHKMYENQVKALQEMFNVRSAYVAKPSVRSALKPSSSDENIDRSRSGNYDSTTPVLTRHRRSMSQGAAAGQLWIDHRPDQIVEPRTVLQPNMTQSKSVRRLRSSDLLESKVSGYCLTTHDLDSSGDVEMKMHKADIRHTAGGGAQVMFNDVEILKQKDVLNLSGGKRTADSQSKVDSQTLQIRCQTALTSHSKFAPSKRVRKDK